VVGKVDCVDDLEFGSTWLLLAWRILATHVDIVAQTLERKDSGFASDVSIGDMGLDAEHPLIHDLVQRRTVTEEVADQRIRPGLFGPNEAFQPRRVRD